MRLLFVLSLFLLSQPLVAQNNCHIFDLTATVLDCADGQFYVKLNFQYDNVGGEGFKVQGNGVVYGSYQYNQVPIVIGPLPANGTTQYEFVVRDILHPDCSDFVELGTVSCENNAPCEIGELSVITGPCNNDGTYLAKVSFDVLNPTDDQFDLWANNEFIGTYLLSELPVVIQNFPTNGGPNDFVKVCINDNADCCRVKEFPVPDCNPQGNCEIYDLVVETGDCNDDGTYHLWLDFEVQNPGNNFFEVWAEGGTYLGIFPLSSLPLHIEHFPGIVNGPIDYVKVCINDHPDCCRVKEFQAPNCAPPQEECKIRELEVETGDCNADGTYKLWLNFQVENPTDDQFDLWANNVYFGTFLLADLPLVIPNFPTDGGEFDKVRVCINDDPGCCKLIKFHPPYCESDACVIKNLKVTTTPCVCGQFFALVEFRHKNGGSGGFDIMGNGVNYGNFPYNTNQPVVIGPLQGDCTTEYEFVVKDHNHPDCADDFSLGVVCCDEEAADRSAALTRLSIQPNPAAERVQVLAASPNGSRVGQSTVEIYTTDGRLVRTETTEEGGNFSLDIAALAPGSYRVRVIGASGVFTGGFVKQ